MMAAVKMALVAALAGLASADTTPDCGHGVMVDTCCVCDGGWKLSGNPAKCMACADGYVMDASGDFCSNGRDGSLCDSGREYPYWGCSVGGVAIGSCDSGGRFPCRCTGGTCEQTIASNQGDKCFPVGTRMHTTFPNQALVEKPFSLTFVGCQLAADDVYVVLPAFTDDLTEERHCATLGNAEDGNVPADCVFDMAQPDHDAVIGNGTCPGTSGFMLKNLEVQVPSEDGMTEATFMSVYIYSAAFGGTPAQRKAANDAERGNDYQILEKETYFRVCKRVEVAKAAGGNEYAWAEVASHDHKVAERDFIFKISPRAVYDPTRAAAAGDDGSSEECCEGLKLGPGCLPLWAFLLIWVIMACCLGAMGFTLHKSKAEINAQKNNEKYEKFNVDAEMSAMAEKQAAEDEDI
ncbi:hypothetical protein DIPPA_14331 [Diplonema papillatum]|nr:hypothetical protein DIPPA_14331 [Diplonema papillatum]